MTITKVPILIEAELTDEFFSDVLTTAFEGGSNYWIDHITITTIPPRTKPKEMPTTEWAGVAINSGGSIRITSTEDDTILTKWALAKGVTLWAKQFPRNILFSDGNRLDASNIDASDADCILQYAVFEKLIFG